MKIALVGNQNSGKTTLFNILTGTNQKIGNWPGVTIERKIGTIKGLGYQLVDLPGIYSLSPYTIEEEVSRKFVLEEKPDLIINIVDATSIERSLYLTTQLMELDTKVIIVLNMADRLEKKGIHIDIEKLSKEIGTDIVSISALKGTGIDSLKNIIKKNNNIKAKSKEIFKSDIENEIIKIETEYKVNRFIAIKILEKDRMYQKYETAIVKNSRQKLEEIYKMDIEEILANLRYEYIVEIKNKSTKIEKAKESISDKLDKVFLNKFIAFPIFIAIMFWVYYLSVGVVGSFTVDWVAQNVEKISETVGNGLLKIGASDWSISLIVDGIIAGVGAVLGFVPQILVLSLLLSILEDVGYMSRVAFIMDKLLRKFGLSGKSIIPMIVATGCGVPGILSSRTIEQENDRKITVMTTGFIPCGAKMPIIGLFAGAVFGNSPLVAVSAFIIGCMAVVISGVILKKFKAFAGKPAPFVMELPAYHMPTARNILRTTMDRGWDFVKRATTIVLVSSIVLWFLKTYGYVDGAIVAVEDSNVSLIASIGKLFAWIFYPLGWAGDMAWKATVATATGLIAKEEVVMTFGTLYNFGGELSEAGNEIWSMIAADFGPVRAYSFMIFNLLCAPCFAAMGAIKREMGNMKWTWITIGYMCGFAYAISMIVYQLVGLALGEATFGIFSIAAVAVLAGLLYLIFRKGYQTGKEN